MTPFKSKLKSLFNSRYIRNLKRHVRTHRDDPDALFDNQAQRIKALIIEATGYLEYGVGKSTVWANKHSNADIYAIDSSKEWISYVEANCVKRNKVNLLWVDLGPLGSFGRPQTLEKRRNITSYINAIWNDTPSASIDLVLIDGRFRISCFYASLAHARAGCVIAIDDYVDRKLYHVVEEDLKPTFMDGRQAHFIVPQLTETQKDKYRKKADEYKLIFD
jgi:hypothetical protein